MTRNDARAAIARIQRTVSQLGRDKADPRRAHLAQLALHASLRAQGAIESSCGFGDEFVGFYVTHTIKVAFHDLERALDAPAQACGIAGK